MLLHVDSFLLFHTFNYLNVKKTTLSNGYLGSRNDEERSEMRYVMRIAEFSESSNLWTQIALLGSPRSTPLSVSVQPSLSSVGNYADWKMRVECLVRSSLEIHRVWTHRLQFSSSGGIVDLDCRTSSDVNTGPCGLLLRVSWVRRLGRVMRT